MSTGRATKPTEIEVTPEMIEAGYQIYLASGITDDPLEADKWQAREQFTGNNNYSVHPLGGNLQLK